MEQHYFIYREPENFDELKALLLLRYRIFRESRLEKFVVENDVCIDLDCYDLYSRHFGLYEHIDDTSRPVSYIRMVTDEPGTFRDELFELAKSIPSLYEKVNSIPRYPFPLMNYCPYVGMLREYYKKIKSDGKMLVEFGRLSLDNSIRGLKVATNFITAICASLITHGADEAVITCVSNHEGIYQGCGAKTFNDTTLFEVHGAGVCLLLLFAAKNLPDSMKEKVYKMAEVYKRFGRICYDPSNPNNYYPPLSAFIKSTPVFTPAVNQDVESDSQSDKVANQGIKKSQKCVYEMHSTATKTNLPKVQVRSQGSNFREVYQAKKGITTCQKS